MVPSRPFTPRMTAPLTRPPSSNQGYALVRLSRLDAAKVAYAKALGLSRRLGLGTSLLSIRFGLASIELLRGNVIRARASFERIAADAQSRRFENHVLSAELRIAECVGRMGDEAGMVARIEKLRAQETSRSLEFDPALRELFAYAEERTVNHEFLAHVARFVEARDRGVRAAYRPFRLVKNGR